MAHHLGAVVLSFCCHFFFTLLTEIKYLESPYNPYHIVLYTIFSIGLDIAHLLLLLI
jgi:hypothetical protein